MCSLAGVPVFAPFAAKGTGGWYTQIRLMENGQKVYMHFLAALFNSWAWVNNTWLQVSLGWGFFFVRGYPREMDKSSTFFLAPCRHPTESSPSLAPGVR